MTIIEQDFINFLIEIGYAQHTANIYTWKLNKFAKENGYANLIELADDVFILLDTGIHGDRKFDYKTLLIIEKNKNLLTLFNSFLFDIQYTRKFVVPHATTMDYMRFLTTDKIYIPNIQVRTLKDSDNPNRQWFTVEEVIAVLHITDHVLKRWEKLPENKKCEKHIPHRYKGPNSRGIDISVNTGAKEKSSPTNYKYNYYILSELNDFLEYQFDYGTGKKRDKYLSDDDMPHIKSSFDKIIKNMSDIRVHRFSGYGHFVRPELPEIMPIIKFD